MIGIAVVTNGVVNRTVVRIRTSYWHDSGGSAIKKWDGRHNKARIEEAKKIVEELRKENGR